MRSFEERKAEIFRRSEKRIKQRIRVLTVCIPLILCVGIATLAISSMGNWGLAEESNGLSEMEMHSQSNREIRLSVTDEAQAARVRGIIGGLFDYSVAIPDSDLEFTVTENYNKIDQYIILLPDGNSEVAEYRLVGSRLVETKTGMEYVLSERQLQELKTALGI